MNEKGCRLACPTEEDVIVPVKIKEIYVKVPENRLSMIVVREFLRTVKLSLP